MSYKPIRCAVIVCDRCGKLFDNGEFVPHHDLDSPDEDSNALSWFDNMDHGWHRFKDPIEGPIDYCDDCSVFCATCEGEGCDECQGTGFGYEEVQGMALRSKAVVP